MEKPRLLDLFCGAGGAAMGYQCAGFYVVGVDIETQPNYCGDEFHQADALTFPLDGFDVIHASPPCQAYIRGGLQGSHHPRLIEPLREWLTTTTAPYVIENVPGAPLRADVVLCGSMFGLPIRRHRWFEGNVPLPALTPPCDHSRPIVGVYGHPHGKAGAFPGMLPGSLESWSDAMGIDWMTASELANAIPPAYTSWIGGALLAALKAAA